jgi:hypothetical protein
MTNDEIRKRINDLYGALLVAVLQNTGAKK